MLPKQTQVIFTAMHWWCCEYHKLLYLFAWFHLFKAAWPEGVSKCLLTSPSVSPLPKPPGDIPESWLLLGSDLSFPFKLVTCEDSCSTLLFNGSTSISSSLSDNVMRSLVEVFSQESVAALETSLELFFGTLEGGITGEADTELTDVPAASCSIGGLALSGASMLLR